jgi:transcriptional regulator with XRE-family HTH domain
MSTTAFGAFIKKLREDRSLKLRDVEERAKVSNAYLSQVERGERGIPNIKVLRRLADAYGVTVEVLIQAAEAGARRLEKMPEAGTPDVRFVSRGYENLSPESKKALTEFLQHLVEKEKKKRK